MTLSEKLDHALAWLLFDFDPPALLAPALFLCGLAVVGHLDVI